MLRYCIVREDDENVRIELGTKPVHVTNDREALLEAILKVGWRLKTFDDGVLEDEDAGEGCKEKKAPDDTSRYHTMCPGCGTSARLGQMEHHKCAQCKTVFDIFGQIHKEDE